MNIYSTIKIYSQTDKIPFLLNRNYFLAERVSSKKVLHVGCSDFPITNERLKSGNLLHAHLNSCTSNILGIDISQNGIDILKKNGFANVMHMNAEEINLKDKYDFIVAGDVIEHINNPGKFLERVPNLLNLKGTLIICVPNAYSFNIIKYFAGMEPTHSDHTFHFSVKSLSELCSRYDLLPTKLAFTVQPKGKYESQLFITLRNALIKLRKRLSPSFIMEFQVAKEIETRKYFEWK